MTESPPGPLHLLEDQEFKHLAARKNRISAVLTGVTLVLYYGFILLIAFKRDLFGIKVSGNVTVGILLGIGVILGCWLLTGIYVGWANRHYDAGISRLREEAGHGRP
jgi:uncharacterized membrane protein (DUF485 family)